MAKYYKIGNFEIHYNRSFNMWLVREFDENGVNVLTPDGFRGYAFGSKNEAFEYAEVKGKRG